MLRELLVSRERKEDLVSPDCPGRGVQQANRGSVEHLDWQGSRAREDQQDRQVRKINVVDLDHDIGVTCPLINYSV